MLLNCLCGLITAVQIILAANLQIISNVHKVATSHGRKYISLSVTTASQFAWDTYIKTIAYAVPRT